MFKMVCLALLILQSSCAYPPRDTESPFGIRYSEGISVRSIDIETSEVRVNFFITNVSDRTVCIYRDALLPRSVFNSIFIRNRRDELLNLLPAGYLRRQDLRIFELLPTQSLELTTSTLMHDIRDVSSAAGGSLSVVMKLAGCDGEDGPTIRSEWTPLPQ